MSRMTFSYCVMFIHMFIFKWKAYRGFSVCHRTVSMAAVYHLKIKYDQDKFGVFFLDAKHLVSFPLEDKHVVNECHVVHDATQKKMPSRGAFQCTT